LQLALRAVDLGAAIGDLAALEQVRVGVMMRIRTAALLAAFAGTFSLPAAGAVAQTAPSGIQVAQASQPAVTETTAQRRIRRLRVYPRYQPQSDGVYPRYYPGRNAVRDCTATYVQEYRPSGTVIVPRMSCYWRRG
jgi:hypothetical protein